MDGDEHGCEARGREETRSVRTEPEAKQQWVRTLNPPVTPHRPGP